MPVLAVVGQVDPELLLALDDLDGGVVQLLGVLLLVDALAVHATAVELDQVVRPRQATGVAGQDGRHTSPSRRDDPSSGGWTLQNDRSAGGTGR
jgi:hypothetical protein